MPRVPTIRPQMAPDEASHTELRSFYVTYIYIYPRGRRFTGNSCPKGVYIYEVGVGLGWGGVGMVTFLELAHMVGATQHHVPCTCTHGRCYASHGMGWGWGGVGWGW